MGLIGVLWNQDLRVRLQRIHRHIARQAVSGEPPGQPSRPRFQRQRPGVVRDATIAVLAEHVEGLHISEIADAVTTRLGEPISPSSIKSCLWRKAQGSDGDFEQIGRGRYRLRSAAR